MVIDVDESALEKYYSLDIDTGKVSTRRLGSGANVIIGVNGKERQASRIAEEEDSDDNEQDSKHQIIIINITINIDISNIITPNKDFYNQNDDHQGIGFLWIGDQRMMEIVTESQFSITTQRSSV